MFDAKRVEEKDPAQIVEDIQNRPKQAGRPVRCDRILVLDDGKIIEFRDFPGFAEKVWNKW